MNQISKVQLDQIITDAGTQARAALNEDVVAEYAEAITAGAEMPPIIVFHDGKRHILADGFHRYFAHVKARASEIAADVRKGTKRDAILYSVSANKDHGLRRTNADKRCAVKTLLADKEWRAWSDREIAELCGVSHPFVAAIRNPKVAGRQEANRKVDESRGGKGFHAQKNNDLQAKNVEKQEKAPGYFPWPDKVPAHTSDPANLPHVEEPSPADIAAELMADNDALRKVNDALKSKLSDDDLRAQLAKVTQLAEHYKREQGVAMDNAAKSQKREESAVRALRRCGKAVGIADPNHTSNRDIVAAVEKFARARSAA